MDADRFDTLARSLSFPRSRRAALSGAAAGGLLSALGLVRAVPETRAAQGGTCVVAFAAQVRQGPSEKQPLMPAGSAGEVRGTLSFSLSRSGSLDNATLTLPDGTSLPVVGDATGHSVQLRIALGPQQALVAVGVGEQEIARCLGAIDGVATGPLSGDLGDWHAAAGVQNVPSGEQGGGTQVQGAAATSGTRTDRSGSNSAPASGTGAGASGSGAASTSSGGGIQNCAPPFAVCGDACVNLQTDPVNCGQCGLPCASELGAGTCIDGACACSPGTTRCNGACVNTERDPFNCGECGISCGLDQQCENGTCVANGTNGGGCPVGQTDCGGICVDLNTDTDNCGTCGTLCPVSPEIYNCEGGVCVPPSCAPLTNCGGLCDDLLTSSLNCGECGIVCGAGQVCSNGVCTCGAGLIDCFGTCVDHQTDPSNCGYCGEVCPSGQCATGICVESVGPSPGCVAGTTDCGSGCTDLLNDSLNCGACGNACVPNAAYPGPWGCRAGYCLPLDFSCPAGFTLCGDVCHDLQTDASACGSCDVVCQSGVCNGGVC